MPPDRESKGSLRTECTGAAGLRATGFGRRARRSVCYPAARLRARLDTEPRAHRAVQPSGLGPMPENLAGSGRAGAARRIVVVDDDPVLRAILRGYLEDAGFRVTEAADGVSLMDALPRLDPALMLLDVKLPGANGFAAAFPRTGLRATSMRPASTRL